MKKYFTALFLAMVMIVLPITALAAETSVEMARTEVKVVLEDMGSTARSYVTDHLADVAKKAKEKAAEAATKVVVENTPSVIEKVAETVTPENLQTWSQAMADGIKAVCSTLNVEVNQFITTDVGKITAGMIVYYIVGDDLIKFAIGAKDSFFTILGYMLCTIVILFSYTRLHLPRKKYTYTANEKGKMIKSKDFTWEHPGSSVFSDEEKHGWLRVLSVGLHVFIFLLFTLIAGTNI